MATVNLLTDVYVGEFGDPIVLTLVDSNGIPVDVSAYNGTKTVRGRTPDAQKTVAWTASFVNTGADGLIQFTPATGDIDRQGDWEAQVELTAANKNKKSYPFIIRVLKAVA